MLTPLLLALAASPVAAPTRVPPVFARVEITAAGEIATITFRNAMAPALDQALRARMAAWRFHPATRNGIAVPSETTLTIWLALREDAERYALDVLNVTAGPEAKQMVVPDYPQQLAAAGQHGKVVVRCRVGGKGVCADFGVHETTAPKALVANALKAALRWKFVPERVAGQPRETWVLIPFCFHNGDRVAACGVQPPNVAALIAESDLQPRPETVGAIGGS